MLLLDNWDNRIITHSTMYILTCFPCVYTYFNWFWVWLTHNVTLVSGVKHWFDKCLHYAVLIIGVATICHYYVIGYILYSVSFIPMTYWFHYWKPVSPTPFTHFHMCTDIFMSVCLFYSLNKIKIMYIDFAS